ELRLLTKRFEREALPLLTPLAVSPGGALPHAQSLGLNVGVVVAQDDGPRFLCIGVPQDVPRFLEVGGRGVHVAIEDALVHFLPSLVGEAAKEHGVFRVTRDADLFVASDADDLLEALETQLRRRRFGDVVRLEIDAAMPTAIRELLVQALAIGPEQVYETAA